MKRKILLAATVCIVLSGCNKHSENENVKQPQQSGEPGATPCMPAALQTGVLAFYSFNNGSINDFSGHSRDLSNTTGAHPGPDRAGNPTCAFAFDNSGTPQFLSTAATAFLNNLPQYSISLWYRPADSARDGGDYETLICRDSNTVANPDRSGQWSVALYDCRRAVFARQNSVWDKILLPVGSSCQSELQLRTGSWHHLAVIYDQPANQMRIYRDGLLQDADVLTGSISSSYQDIGDLFLGRDYTGSLDDVILYNRVLSGAEIQTLAGMAACCETSL